MRSPLRSISPAARLDWLTGGLVLLVYLVMQLWLLLGPQPYDPAKYFVSAVDFPNFPRDYWTLRIGLIAPVRVAVLVLGSSEAALYAVPIATGLLLAVAVYATMLVLFRDRVLAAAAALVTVLNPFHLLNSSFIFPDTTATATFAAAFLCLLLGGERSEEVAARGRAPELWALGAGVLLGWTYLVRELGPILLPAVVVALVLLRYPARRIVLVAAGAVATFSLELLYGAVRYGDPLARVHTLLDRRDASVRPGRLQFMERLQEEITNPLDALLVFPRLLVTFNLGWLFLLLIALFLFGLARTRDRRLWLLGAWFLTFWAVMAAFALWRLPSGELIVNVTNIRYWYPIFPPLVMGAFGTLALLLPGSFPALRRLSIASVVAAALAAVGVGAGSVEFERCADKDVWRNEPSARWHDLRSWFASPASDRYDVVWTDRVTRRLALAFDSGTFGGHLWDGGVESFSGRATLRVPPTEAGRSLVLVHTSRFPGAEHVPQALRSDWAPVFRSGDGRLILLAQAGTGGSDWSEQVPKGRPRGEPGECGLNTFEPGG